MLILSSIKCSDDLHTAMDLSGQHCFTQEDIHALDKEVNLQQLRDMMQDLVSRGLLTMNTQLNKLFFVLVSKSVASKLAGLPSQYRQVYSLISESGRIGMQKRQIITKTKIPRELLDSYLNYLEKEQFIKSIKVSIGDYQRIVYLVYGVSPANQYMEQTWFKDGELNIELVLFYEQKIFEFIVNSACCRTSDRKKCCLPRTSMCTKTRSCGVTAYQICQYINGEEFGKDRISTANVEVICCNLIYDGKVETAIDDPSTYTSSFPNAQIALTGKDDEISSQSFTKCFNNDYYSLLTFEKGDNSGLQDSLNLDEWIHEDLSKKRKN